ARIAAIADQRDRLTPTDQQRAAPAAPPQTEAPRVAAVSPPDQPEDTVTPTDTALLKRVPLPRARSGIHAAAIHAARARFARRAIVRRPPPKPPAPDHGPFGALFGIGIGAN